MEDYELKYVFEIELTNYAKKRLGVESHKELNAVIFYDHNKILINLNSDDFNELTDETAIINFVNRNITHELLHREIYAVTNKVANEYEEIHIVDKILDSK